MSQRYEATMTSKGQLTVPASVRQKLGLKTGDRVEFRTLPNGGCELRKKAAGELSDVVGLLSGLAGAAALTPEEVDAAIAEAVDADDARVSRGGDR